MVRGGKHAEVEHADVQRVKRAHLNSLENILPFFAIGYLYTLTQPSLMMASLLFYSFLALRTLYAVFYLAARQPFRTATAIAASLINPVLAIAVLHALFSQH